MAAGAPLFRLFGLQHLVTLAALFLLGCLIVAIGRRGHPADCTNVGRGLAALLVAYAATIYIQRGISGELSWAYALPLELCHWVMISCVISLLRPRQFLFEIAYFWGFAGTLQAVLTPDIERGFPSPEFVYFFWSHGAVLLAVVFLVACRKFRPRRGSVLRMFLAVNAYALAIGVVDAVSGWNYGYLCGKPVQPTVFDYLGPWPWYLLSLECIALASFWMLDLPWRILDRAKLEKPRP